MAEEAKSDGSAPNWSNLLILVLVAWGIVGVRLGLESTRPAAGSPELARPAGPEDVPARLWQDPLVAVKKAVGKNDTAGESPLAKLARKLTVPQNQDPGPSHPFELFASMKPDSTRTIALMPVLVLGDPYDEGVEARLEARYAVLSALGRSGYVPVDSEHIGYFIASTGEPGQPPAPLTVAFEWYDRSATKDQREYILLLWVNEDALGARPLRQLAQLVSQLKVPAAKAEGSAAPRNDKVPVHIIGPASSTMLATLDQDGRRSALANDKTAEDLVFYSALATSSPVRQRLNSGVGVYSTLKVRHFIGTDEGLARALGEELISRDANPSRSRHVALIAEWDTDYARDMLRSFETAILKSNGAARQDNDWSLVRKYTYLRGIDGKLPGDRTHGGSEGNAPADAPAEPTLPTLPQPTRVRTGGRAQIDYLSRMVHLLASDAREGGFRWSAIGILGSDVHDKILVLRAIRQRFPHALCFTTDLDARLLDRSEFPATHNLVIGSHYGLTVGDPELAHAPSEGSQSPPATGMPFRSVYQTSVYRATRYAINDWLEATPAKQLELGDPLVFEVARSGAYQLTIPRDAPYQPLSPRSTVRLWLAGTELAIVLTGAIVIAIAFGWRANWWWLATTLLCSAALLAIALYDHQRPDGEPFSFTAGISTWPTLIGHFVTGFMCLAAVQKVYRDSKDNAQTLSGDFMLRDDATLDPVPSNGPFVSALEAWREYEARLKLRARLRRLVIEVGFCVAVSMTIFCMATFEARPTRGDINRNTDWVLFFFSVITTAVLLAVAFDETLLCGWFVQRLASRTTVWPTELTVRIAARNRWTVDPDMTAAISRYLNVQLVARRTGVIGEFIWYPSFALLLMFVARSDFFDNWEFPHSLLFVYSTGLAVVIFCAVWLRRAARSMRDDEMEDVRRLSNSARERGQHELAEELDALVEKAALIETGAYGKFSKDPIVQAVLIPVGGMASLPLLQLLMSYVL